MANPYRLMIDKEEHFYQINQQHQYEHFVVSLALKCKIFIPLEYQYKLEPIFSWDYEFFPSISYDQIINYFPDIQFTNKRPDLIRRFTFYIGVGKIEF
jgi:hypothetical protein